jgi:hypothetical protein
MADNNIAKYNQIITNLMPIRMYKEIVEQEKYRKEDLAKIMNFDNLKKDILSIKTKQNELSLQISSNSFNTDYEAGEDNANN